ncbi:uncharacterized protein LOC124118805 isoform X5 [Haliotis rufescens]|uniref:uncharacterized protein LOC124118805 isoform X5 n=1 Tax=Haliotis rufescens TaxID=6454 RepID=UPI001EB0391C|nr:uncharacterized protein LOC124118805 isoform X5 [Haliotis rufescens]
MAYEYQQKKVRKTGQLGFHVKSGTIHNKEVPALLSPTKNNGHYLKPVFGKVSNGCGIPRDADGYMSSFAKRNGSGAVSSQGAEAVSTQCTESGSRQFGNGFTKKTKVSEIVSKMDSGQNGKLRSQIKSISTPNLIDISENNSHGQNTRTRRKSLFSDISVKEKIKKWEKFNETSVNTSCITKQQKHEITGGGNLRPAHPHVFERVSGEYGVDKQVSQTVVDQRSHEGIKVDRRSNDWTKIDRRSHEGTKVDQRSNEKTKLDRRFRDWDKVDQRSNDWTKVDRRSQEGTEVDRRFRDWDKVDQRSNDWTEVDRRSQDGTKVDRRFKDWDKVDQRSNDWTEVGQISHEGTKLDRRSNELTKGDRRPLEGTKVAHTSDGSETYLSTGSSQILYKPLNSFGNYDEWKPSKKLKHSSSEEVKSRVFHGNQLEDQRSHTWAPQGSKSGLSGTSRSDTIVKEKAKMKSSRSKFYVSVDDSEDVDLDYEVGPPLCRSMSEPILDKVDEGISQTSKSILLDINYTGTDNTDGIYQRESIPCREQRSGSLCSDGHVTNNDSSSHIYATPYHNTDSHRKQYGIGSQDSLVDSDCVDVSEIQRRVEYVSSVRARTIKSVRKTNEFLSRIYPQLFEYALVVGLLPKSGVGYKPYVIHKFPETRAYKVGQDGNLLACTNMIDSNVSVPLFCFPDAPEYKPPTGIVASESYSFVLTNIDGERVYGYCRRIQPPDSNLQEVICIISPVDAFNMYNKLLDEIEKRRATSTDLAQELIAASFGRPLPGPGKVVNIRTLDKKGELETLFLNRPSDVRREKVNYECLLSYLGTDKLIKVFSSLMMERRILLCSNSLSILTQTVHALVALLYPFSWQHIYIPILPSDMIDVCASPTPFLIGILTSHLPQVLEQEELLEEVVIVDVDKKQFVRSVGDEATLLPKKLQKALKTAINMCKIDSESETSQWLMVSEAFMRMFIEIMGHFGEHITTQQDGRKVFEKDKFLARVSAKGIRQVLEWFTETQMFEVFMTNQREKTEWGTVDLFMSRLLDFEREDSRDSHKGLGRKMKNFGKAIKTKLGQT